MKEHIYIYCTHAVFILNTFRTVFVLANIKPPLNFLSLGAKVAQVAHGSWNLPRKKQIQVHQSQYSALSI